HARKSATAGTAPAGDLHFSAGGFRLNSMIRRAKTRWMLGVAGAGLLAGVLSVVSSTQAAPAINDDVSLIAARATLPDDESFAPADIDTPMSALIVKSTSPIGNGCAHDSSWQVYSPALSTTADNSRVVTHLLTSADQNLRLRL